MHGASNIKVMNMNLPLCTVLCACCEQHRTTSFLSDEHWDFYSVWWTLSPSVWWFLLPLFLFVAGSTLENDYLLAKVRSHITNQLSNKTWHCENQDCGYVNVTSVCSDLYARYAWNGQHSLSSFNQKLENIYHFYVCCCYIYYYCNCLHCIHLHLYVSQRPHRW